MTTTDMDQLTTPTEPSIVESQLDSVEAYPPPPVPSRRLSGWVPSFRMHERRWWTIALSATLLITAFGIGLLYVDDTSNQGTIRTLTTQNESLTGRNQILDDRLKNTQANLTATLGELAKTKADLEHPHVTIWNVSQQLKGSSWYLAGGIPDTFTYHLQATSTGPMSISILTLEQWAKAIQCVDYGGGSTHYCLHHSGTVISWLSVTSVSYDFHLAEGCADYLTVFTSATTVTVTPNVGVTYNPASSATGACAG
jgi:hypothetical protein